MRRMRRRSPGFNDGAYNVGDAFMTGGNDERLSSLEFLSLPVSIPLPGLSEVFRLWPGLGMWADRQQW